MSYKFLPNIATADVAFDAIGKTIEELFISCALATEEVMVELRTVSQTEQRIIDLENNFLDKLLYDFLEELVYIKDAELLLFSAFDVKIEKKEIRNVNDKQKKYAFHAICKGEKINPETQILRTDVKAVTLHLFKLEQTKAGFKARVILDI